MTFLPGNNEYTKCYKSWKLHNEDNMDVVIVTHNKIKARSVEPQRPIITYNSTQKKSSTCPKRW